MMDPHRYDDMLEMEHPTSKTHPRMSALNRAAQFSPFRALTGYEDQIQDTWHRRCDRILLSDEEQEKIGLVQRDLKKREFVELTCFVEDPGTDGSGGFADGEYKDVSGEVQKLLPEEEILRVGGADWWTDIRFEDILRVRKVNGGDGGECSFSMHRKGQGGPIIFWGTFLHQENTVEHLIEILENEMPDREYTLVPFIPEEWNRDFSPWAAAAAFGDETFAGKGPETLRWLQTVLVPEIASELGENRPLYLAGYSLAGLFSLWAAYETAIFDGIACCSGSLWFEDWDRYVAEHRIQRECRVYLSLGGKEEKTRNRTMARVGDRTRAQEKILVEEPKVIDSVLEWNRGGHFADAGKRLAKGIRWLMDGEK